MRDRMTPWTLQRRQFVAGAAALATATLAGCDRAAPPLEGGFTGIDMARGHQLREWLARGTWPEPAVVRRAQVIIAGGGVAGAGVGSSCWVTVVASDMGNPHIGGMGGTSPPGGDIVAPGAPGGASGGGGGAAFFCRASTASSHCTSRSSRSMGTPRVWACR